MDEITLIRSMREDVEPPTSHAVDAGRRALIDHIGSRPARERKPHRRLRRAGWISGSTIAALAIAAALVLSNTVGLAGWRGAAAPAAADVLNQAALTTITTSDPVVGPGQYLEVKTDAVYSASSNIGTYLATQNGQLYIPYRKVDDWVWVRDPQTAAQTFGPDSRKAASAIGGEDTGDLLRAPEGAFYNGAPSDSGLSSLPRNPTQLLNYIYRTTLGQGVSPDGEALSFIADTLRTGDVPADLRAALYKAAAGIPGVEVVDREATLDGRTGIAIGRDESNGIRQEIIIDPATGLMIGERQVLTRPNVIPGVPVGASIGWTAVTTSVVDSAPGGGSVCGIGMTRDKVKGNGICNDDTNTN
jgi:hypothetical protein